VRKIGLFAVALLIVATLVLYMTTYTVKFTDAAVVATFGAADESSVVKEPGLKFKWPAPIQTATVYDTRARLLQLRQESQQTADNRQINVETFVTWRVADPLLFYQKTRGDSSADPREHYKKAERIIEDLVRSAMSEVSRFRLTELFTPQIGASRLPELEAAMMARLQSGGAAGGEGGGSAPAGGVNIASYGIDVIMIGVSRITLPEQNTREVFEAMKATQERLAAKARSEGQALATAIKSEAENDARKILAFTEVHVSSIKDRGDREAAQYLAAQNEDPQLAVLLKQIEFLKNAFGKQVTLILPTTMPGIELFGPDWAKGLIEGAPAAAPAKETPVGAAAQPGDQDGSSVGEQDTDGTDAALAGGEH